jgi:hypothetical protein
LRTTSALNSRIGSSTNPIASARRKKRVALPPATAPITRSDALKERHVLPAQFDVQGSNRLPPVYFPDRLAGCLVRLANQRVYHAHLVHHCDTQMTARQGRMI